MPYTYRLSLPSSRSFLGLSFKTSPETTPSTMNLSCIERNCLRTSLVLGLDRTLDLICSNQTVAPRCSSTPPSAFFIANTNVHPLPLHESGEKQFLAPFDNGLISIKQNVYKWMLPNLPMVCCGICRLLDPTVNTILWCLTNNVPE